MKTVHISRDFDAPVANLYDYLSVHENLQTLFGLRVERIKEGDTEANGVGSVRKLSLNGIAPFEETVTEAVTNERIEYRITKGSPLKDHHGVMVFSSTASGGSHLDYTINFGSAVPGLDAVVAMGLGRAIERGLGKIEPELQR